MSAKIKKRAKNRDYTHDIGCLEAARDYLLRARYFLRSTGAVQTKAKLHSLLKSLDGAIRNAELKSGRTP